MTMQMLAQQMNVAYAGGEPLLPPSSAMPELDLASAYALQKAYVARRLEVEAIGGFKAGATAPGPQKAFGLREPISGVLFRSGLREDGATVRLADFRMLMLEVELGFRVGRPIASVPDSPAELRHSIAGCLPMVELAEIPFGGSSFSGLDLIAANSASCAYIAGAEPDWRAVDINGVKVALTRDGELLHEAPASDVMADQWRALHWLVSRVIDQGYRLEPGQILMTGSIGAAHPGRPGRYVAEFAGFGRLSFEVVA